MTQREWNEGPAFEFSGCYLRASTTWANSSFGLAHSRIGQFSFLLAFLGW